MLLPKNSTASHKPPWSSKRATISEDDPIGSFVGLNALEIAAITDAKKFLGQRVVQTMVNKVWHGEIVFWECLSVYSRKQAKVYNKGYVPLHILLCLPPSSSAFSCMLSNVNISLLPGLYIAIPAPF